MVVMIDVDDVLADFNKAFLQLAHEMFNTPVDVEIRVWDFHLSIPGLTREKELLVWQRIRETENFYESLPTFATVEDFENLRNFVLHFNCECVFITSRFPTKGRSVEVQTTNWIRKHVGVEPKVLVTSEKGSLCRKIGIQKALEDAPHHICDLTVNGIETVIMDWPYNRKIKGLPRVKSVTEFLSLIES